MSQKDPEVRRAYIRARYTRIRTEWIEANGPCSCGSDVDLEVDHKDPATKVTNAVWAWGKVKREAELAKCQVLCHECHLNKTSVERKHSHCPSGHALSGDNLSWSLSKGKQRPRCLTCHRKTTREAMRKYRLGKRVDNEITVGFVAQFG